MPFIEPTDEHFKRLLAQARAINTANEKLRGVEKRQGDAALARANQIAERFAWKPQRAIALVEEQICQSCGCVSQLFRGFAIEYRRKSDDSLRIEATEVLDEGLPLRPQRHILPSTSVACMECLPERNI